MDPIAAVQLAATAIEALLKLVGSIKTSHGLTDDQVMASFQTESQSTKDTIAGYLAKLPA